MTAIRTPNAPGSRRWIFWIFLLLAAFYLGVEHRAHLAGALGWLPLAFLLLCPLMHVFMHKGHGGHAAHGRGSNAEGAPDGPGTDGKTVLTDETSENSNGGH